LTRNKKVDIAMPRAVSSLAARTSFTHLPIAEALMALDSDSMKFLEEVKKGKPRRFAMVMKGEKIVSLVLFKKGSLERYKKEAKEEGTGHFYHGVIDGKGQNIVFKLCRADGFDEPPGKDTKLRVFLKEEADLQFQPTYEIVDELPTLVDADDEPSIETPAPPAPDPALSAKLSEALSKMAPLIKQAVATSPDRKTEILQPAADIKTAIAEGRLNEAKTAIVEYGAFIKAITSGGPPDDAPKSAPSKASSPNMAPWVDARQNALDQLTTVARAVAATKDPDAKGAIIELQSIIKNLTALPDTPQKIAELERYLRDDDVITAAEEAPEGFGPIRLREPLLKALATLTA
jgi:hypothetical protein